MEKRKIGSLEVSVVGVGCNNFGIRIDEAQTKDVINAALDEGTRVANFERYRKLLTEDNLDKLERLIEYAESHGRTMLELAIAWLLAHDVVASVIAGASSAQQVRTNVSAAGWQLTGPQLEEIDALLSREVGNATA